MTFSTSTYIPYEDNVLDILSAHQIKQAIFSPQLQASSLPTVLTGTTTGGSSTTALIDSGATFSTNGISVGDIVYNSTDGSYAIVKSVDSEIQLTCTALNDGSDNTFQTSDGYAIRGVPNQQIVLTAIDGANKPGVYKRNSGNTSWEIMELQNKMNGTATPASSDDSGSGYSVGSLWFDTTGDRAYVCLDATASSAVWKQIDNPAASDLSPGIVELATSVETTAGTDATRAVTPDSLSGSKFGERGVELVIFDSAADVATGDGKIYFHIDSRLSGMNLIDAHAEVNTAGATGTTDIQINNVTQAADMLTTKITIDSGETGSDTAATPAVIDTANDDVAENDILRIDVDAVSTTAPKGLMITLGFRLP